MRQFVRLMSATLLSPLDVALVAIVEAAWSVPESWRILIGVNVAVIMYAVSLALIVLVLLPVHLLVLERKNSTLWHYVIVSCVATLVFFVGFSLFTGSFGPPHDWYWLPFAAILQGIVFGHLARRRNPKRAVA